MTKLLDLIGSNKVLIAVLFPFFTLPPFSREGGSGRYTAQRQAEKEKV